MLCTAKATDLYYVQISIVSEIVKLLLLFGADVNDPGGDHCGNVTPLHDSSQNGHIETVKLLISRGANPLARDAKVLYCRYLYKYFLSIV